MKVVTSLFKTISQPHLSKHRQKKLHRTIQPVIDLSFLKNLDQGNNMDHLVLLLKKHVSYHPKHIQKNNCIY